MKFVIEGEERMKRLANSKKLKLNHAINVSRGTPEKSKLMKLVPKAVYQKSNSAHRQFFKAKKADKIQEGVKALHRRVVSKNMKQDGAFKALKKLHAKQIEGGERATKTLARNPNHKAHGKLRVAQFMGKKTKKVEDRFKGPINTPSKNPHKNNGESPHVPYESVQEDLRTDYTLQTKAHRYLQHINGYPFGRKPKNKVKNLDRGKPETRTKEQATNKLITKFRKVGKTKQHPKIVREGSASISKLQRAVKGSKKIDFMKHMDMQNQIHRKKEDGAKRFSKNASSYKENPKFKTWGQGLSRSKSHGKNLGKPETRSGDSPREKYTRQDILKKKIKGAK